LAERQTTVVGASLEIGCLFNLFFNLALQHYPYRQSMVLSQVQRRLIYTSLVWLVFHQIQSVMNKRWKCDDTLWTNGQLFAIEL